MKTLEEALRRNKEAVRETSEVAGDKWNISLPKTRIHTLDGLVKFFKIDLRIWEVERFIANKWEVGAKVGSASSPRLKVEPLFQVKAFLRKKRNIVNARREIEELKRLGRRGARLRGGRARKSPPSGNMLEINPIDHHFAKLAWARETGHKNYDVAIADKSFAAAVSSLLERTKSFHLDVIWLVLGNDLFNSDNAEGQTTMGTHVSTDGRYPRTFGVVRTRAIWAIEECRKRARKVVVIMVKGNHDEESVWHLGDSLQCYFHKTADVEIDNEPTTRKYHRFGRVMVMFTHGDKGKRADYAKLMASEQKAMWSATDFHEAHTGHRHKTKVDEEYGFRERILPALCPPDDWHAERGFVGNLQSSEAFLWNRREGLIGTVIYTEN